MTQDQGETGGGKLGKTEEHESPTVQPPPRPAITGLGGMTRDLGVRDDDADERYSPPLPPEPKPIPTRPLVLDIELPAEIADRFRTIAKARGDTVEMLAIDLLVKAVKIIDTPGGGGD